MDKAHIGEDVIDKEMYEILESQNARPSLHVEPSKTLLGDARFMHNTSSREEEKAKIKIFPTLKKYVSKP